MQIQSSDPPSTQFRSGSIPQPVSGDAVLQRGRYRRIHDQPASEAFRRAGYQLELIAVDNGSNDRTGEIIRSLGDRIRT